MILNKTLPKAWKAFTHNKRYLLIIILLEFIFLFALTQIHLYYFAPSAEAATRAGEIMAQEIAKIPQAEIYELENILLENEDFKRAYRDLLTSMAYFILSFFALWVVFRGPIWYLSHKSILKKVPVGTTILKFALMSIFWFLITVIVFIIYSVATGSTATILPIVSSTLASFTMFVVFAAIWYFTTISYALIPAQQTFKKTFILGTKHVATLLQAFTVNAVIIFIALTLPFNWIETQPLLSLAIILFITIPALAFARLHIIVATWSRKSTISGTPKITGDF